MARIENIDVGGPDGVVRFVRRELGVEAFGINWFELPPGYEGWEHDETDSGQEEVAVVVAGSGVWRIDSQAVPVEVGTFLRFDPSTRRCPVAGPDGLTFICIGARRGSYDLGRRSRIDTRSSTRRSSRAAGSRALAEPRLRLEPSRSRG